MKLVLSLRDLSVRLGVSREALRKIANNIEAHYRWFPREDKNGHIRQLKVPNDELKDVQRRINRRILALLPLSACAHGSVPRRSCRSNAVEHLGRQCTVNLDVRKFFPSISHRVVYRMFRHELGFGRDVASLLTRLTTFRGEVPQGAPTSGAIANLILSRSLDEPVLSEAARSAVRFTRYLDDITLSGANPRPLINPIARLLSRRGLSMHRQKRTGSKLKISSQRTSQEVTGLIVNRADGLSLSRQRRDAVRAAIHNLRALPDEASLQAALRSVIGRIAYVREYNPGAAARLDRYLTTMLRQRGEH